MPWRSAQGEPTLGTPPHGDFSMRPGALLPLFASVFSLVACESVRDAGPTGPFTLSVPDPWPGSTVYVSSPDFRRGVTSATLRVDTFTVQLIKSTLNDSTMSGVLPLGVSGEVTTEVTVDGVRIPTRPIQVAGHVETRDLLISSQIFDGPMFAWPQQGQASVLGEDRGGNASILNLETGTERSVFKHVNSALRSGGPGSTYQSGVFLFRRVTGVLESWDLNTGSVGTSVNDGLPLASDDFHSLKTRLGPNTWILGDEGDKHEYITRPNEGAAYSWIFVNGPYYGVQFSPRGDRAAGKGVELASGGQLVGMPVYRVPTGDVAFRLSPGRIGAVAFTADGAVLVTASSASNAGDFRQLRFLDATTGAVRADTLLSETVMAIGTDPLRPYVFVAVRNANGLPAIDVYSSTTFKRITRLPTHGTAALGSGETLLLTSRDGGLYFYAQNRSANSIGARVYRFALPSP